jgi:hypothetical protein
LIRRGISEIVARKWLREHLFGFQLAWARRSGAILTGTENAGSSKDFGDLGAATVANDRVIASIGVSTIHSAGAFSVTGITDTQGNTWNRDLQEQHDFGTDFGCLEVWSTVANGTSVTHITVTFSGNLTATGGAAVAIGAYSGIDTTVGAGSALDVSKSSSGGSTGPADSGTTAGNTTAANELKIGAYADDGVNKTLSAGTVDTTYSVFAKLDASTTEETLLEDADSGSSGSTARAEVTWASGTVNWNMAVLVYKLSAAADNLSALIGEPITGSSQIEGGLR